jgi:hypothetical protein
MSKADLNSKHLKNVYQYILLFEAYTYRLYLRFVIKDLNFGYYLNLTLKDTV